MNFGQSSLVFDIRARRALFIWGLVISVHIAFTAVLSKRQLPPKKTSPHSVLRVKTIDLKPPALMPKPQPTRVPKPSPVHKKALVTEPPATSFAEPAKPPLSPGQTKANPMGKVADAEAKLAPKPKPSPHSKILSAPLKSSKSGAPRPGARLDEKRARARSNALALIGSIGQRPIFQEPKISERSPLDSEPSASGANAPDELEDLYSKSLIELLERQLHLPEPGLVKVRLLISRDGSYNGHAIIGCKSALNRAHIDRELPALRFLPPASGANHPGVFTLNLNGQ